MREIISKRSKGPYIFIFVTCLTSMLPSFLHMRDPMLCYIFTPFVILFLLISAVYAFLIIDPHGVIESVDDTIVIRRIMQKTVICKRDLLAVYPTPYPNKPDKIQKNAVTIEFLENGKKETLVCGDVKDPQFAVERLTEFMNN